MKKLYFLTMSLIIFFGSASCLQDVQYGQLIDTISVTLYAENDTDIIMQSEIDRPGIDGSMRSQKNLVLEKRMGQEAKKYKMIPDEEMVDKRLKEVQRINNLTHEGLKQALAATGYTYEEAREQFAQMTAISNLLDVKVRTLVVVTEQEIQNYFDKNPIQEPTEYYVQRAVVKVSAELSKEELYDQLMTEKGVSDLVWLEPFWIKKEELAEDKFFITELQVGEISAPQELSDGFELFRLQEKHDERVVPLQEREREIANDLRRARYDQLMEAYYTELLNTASIVYL
ncbi:MAG TPA: hypothetical protein VGT41_03760 [Candidatus Babeliales bacterium]|nr:hypothetical protein [Candidatus Babeliales bacterium]